MSRYDYEASRALGIQDHPFSSLVMAAMRQADTAKTAVAASVYCCDNEDCLFDARHYIRERTGHLGEYHPFNGGER